MSWTKLQDLLVAMAPAAGGAGQQQQTAPWYVQLFPFFLLIFVFYFVFIRPQQRKAKQHDLLLKSIKPGDKVVTSGGILGTVVSVKDKTVAIRSADTKFEVLKSAVSEITERTGDAGEAH